MLQKWSLSTDSFATEIRWGFLLVLSVLWNCIHLNDKTSFHQEEKKILPKLRAKQESPYIYDNHKAPHF